MTEHSNIAEYTVSDLSIALKRTVEEAYGFVRVRGEISGWRGAHSSGHAYFALKDDRARLEAVIWKGAFQKMKVRPEEGMDVIATGKLTTFPGSSKYQIVIEAMEPAGIGALMALLEERRRKLAAEGLFDPARKRALPFLPQVIGVVTSPTGAVIRDILHRVADRFPVRVIVWPVRVQGEGCGAEVAAAVRGFDALPPDGAIARPDVVIVARGGGSLEDLWGFNDEEVVRAVAASGIPVISAVGHETDWTLIDHVADMRAPTPTGAAELAVPVRADLLARLDSLARQHAGAISRRLLHDATRLRAAGAAMPSLRDLFSLPRQRFDRASSAFDNSLTGSFLRRRQTFERAAMRLSPRFLTLAIERQASAVDGLAARLRRGFDVQSRRCAEGLGRMGELLRLVSYRSVLARGFALVRDAGGAPVKSVAGIAAGAALHLQFADGTLDVTADDASMRGKTVPVKPASRKAARRGESDDQSSLF